jgi:hypothetical protein
MRPNRRGASALFAFPALLPLAIAQCNPVPQPGFHVAGVDGSVAAAVAWDPDGPGPLGEHLVVGGFFSMAGGVRANGIAAFDPVSRQWRGLGNLSGRVKALAVLPNGDLVAGGSGVSIGGLDARSVARWDGSAWNVLGGGVTGPPLSATEVRSLTVRPNGDLIVGGQFSLAGGLPAVSIARWDGAAWHSMGNLTLGGIPPSADTVAALPNGDVIAGGLFDSAGGVPATRIARWDGSTWYTLGSGIAPATPGGLAFVRRLLVRGNGDLIVAGSFAFAGGQPANNIARWDGTVWSPLGAGLSLNTIALLELPNGDLLAGGYEVLGSQAVASFDGTAWTGMGNLPPFGASALARLGNGELFAGGDFRPQGTFTGRGIASWNGSDWQGVTQGNDGTVAKVLDLGNGRLFAIGDLRAIAGVPVQGAALFDGQAWQPAGTPVVGTLTAATALPNGRVAIAVLTNPSATNSICTVQLWDGAAWTTIGRAGDVRALASAPNGDLYMGGNFGAVGMVPASWLAVWNGSSWAQAPESPAPSSIRALLWTRSGQLVASHSSLGFISRWNGTAWTQLGGGLQQPPTDLVERSNGDLIAIGNWGQVNGATCLDIARFDGVADGLGRIGVGDDILAFGPRLGHADPQFLL